MRVERGVTVAHLLAEPRLRAIMQLVAGQDGQERSIDHPRVQKPGLAGVFEITLSVADAHGNTATDTFTVTIVDITAPELVVGEPEALFEARRYTTDLCREYDVSGDGRRVIITRTPEGSRPREAQVVLNWFSELERLAGPGGTR